MKHFTKKMIKNISLAAFAVFGVLNMAYGQTIEWTGNQGDVGSDFIWESDIDSDGNMYTTGMYFDDIDLDPGAGVAMFTSAGQQDIFVSKLDAAGNFLWGHSFGNTLRDRSNAIAVGDDGSVYIAGYFEDVVDFDPGVGVFNLTAVGSRDCFILKLDTNGDFVWVTQFGGSNDAEINGIDVDPNDNVYVTGVYRDTYNFNMSGTAELTAEGVRDIFIAKLDNNGDYLWARSIGGVSDEFNTGMTVDNNGSVYTTGYFNGSVEMDPGAGSSILTSGGGQDGFLLKLDTDGIFEWVNQLYSASNSRGTTVTVDASNNVVLGGRFDGTVEFDYPTSSIVETALAPSDFFIMKMNEMGNVTWVNHYENTGTADVDKLTTNNLEEVYATGSFSGDINFDIVGATAPYTGDGPRDLFVLRLGEDGSYIYDNVATGPGNNQGYGINVNNSWEIYIGGYFSDVVTFSDVSVLTSADGVDGIVYKLGGFCTAPDAPTLTETANDFCPNTTTTIDITAGNLNDASDWVWYSDSLFTDSIFAGTSFTTPSLTDTVTYYVRGEGACVVGTSSITINVADNEAPNVIAADFTIATDAGACEATGVDLGETITDNCALDQIVNDAPATFPIGQTTVTWTVTDLAGNETIHEQIITVEDQEAPVADAATLNDIVELCEVTMLTAPTATDNCDGSIAGTHDATLPIIVTSTITWTYEDANGNTSTQQQEVIIEGVDVSTTVVGTTLTANNSNLGVFYRWVDCNNNFAPIVNATNQVFTPEENGSYAVVILEDGCQDTSACIDVTTVGLEDYMQTNINVYPNPSAGEFNIELASADAVNYKVIDNAGRIVLEGTFEKLENIIDLSTEVQGVYFLYVEGSVKKLIVQ